MFGPGHGHNIKKWIDYFDNKPEYELFFLANTPFAFDQGKHTQVINKKNNLNLIKLLPLLRKHRYDLLLIHGGFNWRVLSVLLFLLRYKKSIFIPWGLKITEMAAAKNIGGIVYRWCFQKMDTITSTYSIQKAIEERLPQFKHKLQFFLWGLDMKIISKDVKATKFTQNFLATFKADDLFIFYPRSIIPVTRFDLVIEAMGQIKDSIPSQTKMVIWHGNETDLRYEAELKSRIKKHELDDVIEFVKHPYLPDNDIYTIWKRANFTVNIINTDGLSSQFMEALIFEKPILLSRISTYTPFDEEYSLALDFADNNVTDVASGLKEMFLNYGTYNKEILAKRKEIALKHFNFEANVTLLLDKMLN